MFKLNYFSSAPVTNMSGNAVLLTKKKAVFFFFVIAYSSLLTQAKMDKTRALLWGNKLSTIPITVSLKVNKSSIKEHSNCISCIWL